MRPNRGNVATSPALIGAATTLVILVAMFLSYNANNGLPFVPTYELHVDAPSAANLVRGNEVRIGGARVGVVSAIEPVRRDDGTSVARLSLALERKVDPLPKDSTIVIRPRSVLGLKYVEINRGRAADGYRQGDIIPVSAAKPAQVEFDEVANVFDAETRDAARLSLQGFGDALAGRGDSINLAIGALRPLLRDIVPVARNLSSRETNLARLVRELSDAARIVAPAAETQAELFVNLDATFSALQEVARPYIQDAVAEGPATLDAAIRELPRQRPFLRNTAGLFRELRPGVRALRGAAPDLSEALRVGTPTLRRSLALSRRLEPLLESVERFATDPLVPRGVRRLNAALASLLPTLQFLAPVQLQCNYVTLWFRNVASHLSEGDANGTWQRFIVIAVPQGPNNEGGPSSAPADGPTVENHLHFNAYPNTAAPGQPKECEAGNEPYEVGATRIGNVPGTQHDRTEGNP